jgi:hypothetical protein
VTKQTAERGWNQPRPKMLSCSKLEQDDMASDNHSDQPASSERETPGERPSPARPSTKNSPPLHRDGLELVRSSDC